MPYANVFALSPEITSMQLNVILGTISSSLAWILSISRMDFRFSSSHMAAPVPPIIPETNFPIRSPFMKVITPCTMSFFFLLMNSAKERKAENTLRSVGVALSLVAITYISLFPADSTTSGFTFNMSLSSSTSYLISPLSSSN